MKPYEEGRLTSDKGITVVEVFGSWQEMGAQYGRLAKPYLEDVLAFIDSKLATGPEAGIAKANDIADKLYANCPDYLKDFFDAATVSSGIALDRLKLCNAVEYIEGCFFCSAMAVWDEYSSDGLVFGRNYDAVSFGGIDKDVLITVYHPDDGLAAATIGYAGEIYCVNGFNEKGLFVELNNGMPSAGWDIHWDMRPATTELFDLIIRAETLDDVEACLNSVRSPASFIIGVADSHEARVYEWCFEGVRRSDGMTPGGLMVGTNHYSHPDWEFVVPTDADSWNSLARRANLLARAEKYKGRIDVERMKTIMSTSIEGGGPWHPFTRYQLVVVPSSMTIHIKLSFSSDWVQLELDKCLLAK